MHSHQPGQSWGDYLWRDIWGISCFSCFNRTKLFRVMKSAPTNTLTLESFTVTEVKQIKFSGSMRSSGMSRHKVPKRTKHYDVLSTWVWIPSHNELIQHANHKLNLQKGKFCRRENNSQHLAANVQNKMYALAKNLSTMHHYVFFNRSEIFCSVDHI